MCKAFIRDAAAEIQEQDPEMNLVAQAGERRIADLRKTQLRVSGGEFAEDADEFALADKDACCRDDRNGAPRSTEGRAMSARSPRAAPTARLVTTVDSA